MTGYIYVITNDVNGKQYVGKTTDTLAGRFSDHCKDSVLSKCKGRPLYYAMNKYGKEHFHISQLEECELDILPEREQFWIKELDTYHNGYNATLGGEGKQYYDYNLFVQDFNNGMNIKEIAQKYYCDPETVSKALRKAGLDTFRGSKYNAHSNRIPILQFSMDENFLQEFDSIWTAAIWIIENHFTTSTNRGQVSSNISGAARQIGYRKSAYGFKWRLKEEEEEEN